MSVLTCTTKSPTLELNTYKTNSVTRANFMNCLYCLYLHALRNLDPHDGV